MNHNRVSQYLFPNISSAQQIYSLPFLDILFLASHYYFQNHKGHRTMQLMQYILDFCSEVRRVKTKCLVLYAARLPLVILLRSILISFSYQHKWITHSSHSCQRFSGLRTPLDTYSLTFLKLISQIVNIICIPFLSHAIGADLSKFKAWPLLLIGV